MLLETFVIANAMMDDAVGATTKADAIEAAMDELADAGLLVGVDITPPGIEIEATMIGSTLVTRRRVQLRYL